MPPKQAKLEQVFQHIWSTDDRLMARLAVRLEDIAAKNDLTLQNWIEDGLGPAIGCGGRLPSGVIIFLRELEHLISRSKAKGPDVFADAADLQEIGVDKLLSETLSALSLDPADVEFTFPAPTVSEVRDIRRAVDEIRRKRASAEELR